MSGPQPRTGRTTSTARSRQYADADVDVLLLGRSANIRYVSGAEPAVTPPAPAPTHRAASSSARLGRGAPAQHHRREASHPKILPANLYPLKLEPDDHGRQRRGGAGRRTRRGQGRGRSDDASDGRPLLRAVLPGAELLDAEALLRTVRRPKSADDVDGIERAVGIAEQCIAATDAAIASGVTERELLGRFELTMGSLGITTPAFEASVCVAGTSPRWIVTDRALRTGDLVNLRGGVLVDGWEGVLARSRGLRRRHGTAGRRRCAAAATLAEAVAACVPGTGVGDLRARPDVTAVDGAGLGHEELADDDVLAASDVVYVEVFVGQVLLGDMVHVTDARSPAPHHRAARRRLSRADSLRLPRGNTNAYGKRHTEDRPMRCTCCDRDEFPPSH